MTMQAWSPDPGGANYVIFVASELKCLEKVKSSM